ncbi:MAG: 3-hydroxyacyl-CoA dehydrogenase NAD-binding domain-containing protein [Methylococcaceae bacterium]
MSIKTAAVIGAGVMGAGIAAHLSNAGIPVYLLDIVDEESDNRNAIAEQAVKKLLHTDPSPFMHKKNAGLIVTGNTTDHLDWLKNADWIIEAVIENLEIKRTLYQTLDTLCNSRTLISSNTSTLPLALLTKDMPKSFCQRFMITHFFNPPRYMKLLEVVQHDLTRPELSELVLQFTDQHLGKTIVFCKDTPGFIANRIGTYWLQCGILEAIDQRITIEQADSVISAPFGIPKTGVFGLLDLIGIDLVPHIIKGMLLALPPEDPFREISHVPARVKDMIAEGSIGRKGKGGFYRLQKSPEGKRFKQGIVLDTGEYRASEKPQLDCIKNTTDQGLQGLLSYDDDVSNFAWQVISKTLCYAAYLVPEIADDIPAIDEVMKKGYNWQLGPFELLDKIGIDWFVKKLEDERRPVPDFLQSPQPFYQVDKGQLSYLSVDKQYQPIKRRPGVFLLSDAKLKKPAILHNASASLWDIDDGIACLEFHSKMNTLNPDIMAIIEKSIAKTQEQFAGLVIHNEAEQFSAGANLFLLVTAIHQGAWSDIDTILQQGQSTYNALKYAPFPVVGAPSGLALGGGCEILLHCDAIQAHAELYMGLVEVGVGLIPAWGGCKELLHRWLSLKKRPGGPMPAIAKTFETISTAKVSKSAIEAKELLFLSKNSGISMNKDRLLADAKQLAISLSQDYQPTEPPQFLLPGKTGLAALKRAIENFLHQGKASAYDAVIAEHLASILSGADCDITDPLTEDELLKLERSTFIELCKRPETLARLEHMLKKGKPLRN